MMSEKCKSGHPDLPGASMLACDAAAYAALPDWVPSAVRLYLAHTEDGLSLRQIARTEGVHASTVLRQVRRFESRRDDPLIDHLLGRFRRTEAVDPAMSPKRPRNPDRLQKEANVPTDPALPALPRDELRLAEAAARYLPLLAQEDTILAVAADMDKAVILRDAEGASQRLAILERTVAEAFALRDWIACTKAGRVAQYALTAEGRLQIRRSGARDGGGLHEAPAIFTGAPFRSGQPPEDDPDARFRPPPESPVAVLARRRDRDGAPFLSPRMVVAAERLREDFEIAQMEPRVTQDWHSFLSGPVPRGGMPGVVPGATPAAARARLKAALSELGPGLGDVALRCCCWQEGIETAEQKLGWSARSGKIVLRIALERLARHYEALGEAGKLIG